MTTAPDGATARLKKVGPPGFISFGSSVFTTISPFAVMHNNRFEEGYSLMVHSLPSRSTAAAPETDTDKSRKSRSQIMCSDIPGADCAHRDLPMTVSAMTCKVIFNIK